MLQERAFPIIHELIKDAVSRVRIPSSPPAMIGRGEHRVGKQRVDEMAPHTRGWEEGDSKTGECREFIASAFSGLMSPTK